MAKPGCRTLALAWGSMLGAALAATRPASQTAPSTTATAPVRPPRPRSSYHAARANAVGKLVEQVLRLKIAPAAATTRPASAPAEASVRDFLQDANAGGLALRAFLGGLPDAGEPNYADDGACEVPLRVALADVRAALRHIHRRHSKDGRFRVEDLGNPGAAAGLTEIQATGRGTVREEFAGAEPAGKAPGGVARLPKAAETFWAAHSQREGRRAAERTARLGALRRLTERIRGVHVMPDCALPQFLAASDDPNVDLQVFLKGARRAAVRYHHDALVVDVDMVVPLRTVYASLRSWGKRHFRDDRAKLALLEELTIRAKDVVIRETGQGAPPEHAWRAVTPRIRKAAALAGAMPAWPTRSLKASGTAQIAPGAADRASREAWALRLAETDARLDLARQLRRLPVPPAETLGALTDRNDRLAAAVGVFEQSARVTARTVAGPKRAEATIEVDLWPLWNAVLRLAD